MPLRLAKSQKRNSRPPVVARKEGEAMALNGRVSEARLWRVLGPGSKGLGLGFCSFF